MSACEAFQEDLVLYAEGELKDAGEASRIRFHLASCGSCREWMAEYDSFTRNILESEQADTASFRDSASVFSPLGPPEGTPVLSSLGSPEETPVPWDGPVPFANPGASFTDRVMSAVRGVEARRRTARIRSLAAALALFAGLAAGGALYLRARFEEQAAPAAEVVVLSPRGEASFVAPPGSGPRRQQVQVAAGRPADLKSARWVIDPERESRRVQSEGIEGLFFGQADRAAGSSQDLHYLILKALLGADDSDLLDDHRGFNFAMVPEEVGRERAIPVRPVALPIEVDERELAPPALDRLRSARGRYRLVFIGRDGFEVQLGPGAVAPARGVPASPLRDLTSPPRIPIEFLPSASDRQ